MIGPRDHDEVPNDLERELLSDEDEEELRWRREECGDDDERG